jgi:photosystem II stability/assembly factor-like uncharacterized protein
MRFRYITLAVLFLSVTASGQWVTQQVNTTASFRGLSVVSEKIVWSSGTGGTVINTADGGKTWKIMAVPGAEKLDFRDVEAFDANTAYVLSIGNGDSSRIYKTIDGGTSWKLQFTNKNEKAFFDAIACWDAANCVAMSDPVDGRYLLISTTDGQNWTQPGTDKKVVTPPAVEGEAAFAASGTCLIAQGATGLFLVSGGKDARVFSSNNRGSRWSVAETSFVKGTAGSGIFSIAMLDEKNGVMVGGNYEKPDDAGNNLAFTINGGWNWTLAEGLSGYRSGVAYIDEKTIIAVGTNGTDISYDRGGVWRKMGTENLNAVAAKGRKAVWAVGPKGLIVKLK